MKDFEAKKTVESIRCMLGDSRIVEDLGNCSTRKNVIIEVEKQCQTLMRCCEEAGLEVSVEALKRLSLLFHGGLREELVAEVLFDNIWKVLVEVEAEMSLRLYFILDRSEVEMYTNPLASWETVIGRFENSELVKNIEEMIRCYVLNRFTASMFHAMHVAEWGAIALGDYIGVADPRRGWGATKRGLAEMVKAGHSKLPSHLNGQFAFLEQVNQEMDTMSQAWRNKIDHAAGRLAIMPNEEFSSEVAKHIMGSTKAFMLRLAEGMPK